MKSSLFLDGSPYERFVTVLTQKNIVNASLPKRHKCIQNKGHICCILDVALNYHFVTCSQLSQVILHFPTNILYIAPF